MLCWAAIVSGNGLRWRSKSTGTQAMAPASTLQLVRHLLLSNQLGGLFQRLHSLVRQPAGSVGRKIQQQVRFPLLAIAIATRNRFRGLGFKSFSPKPAVHGRHGL